MSAATAVLITGASGFVGSAVARTLLQAGFPVRALVRQASPRFHLDGLDLEFVTGDLRDANSVRRAVSGIRYVFHVAADYRLWARDPGTIYAANVDGTRNVMQEALRAGVERVVYTSSVATLGWPYHGAPGDETVPLSEQQGVGTYKRSKIAAERLVEAMGPAIDCRPSSSIPRRRSAPAMCARRPPAASSSRRRAAACRASSTPVSILFMSTTSPTDTSRRYAAAHRQRYILGGENVLLADMLGDIASLGRPASAAAARSPCRRHAVRLCRRNHGALHRTRTICDLRRPAHGRASHVLSPPPKPNATSAFARGPIARR